MRIRTIKPDFWTHPIMAKMSDPTKLLAIGLLNLADDEGYFYAEPKMVRNALRPLDDDSRITTVSLLDLSKIGYIELVEHPTHGQIGKVVSFLSHQVINKPKSSIIRGLFDYGSNTVSIPEGYGEEWKGMEGNGMESPPTPQGGNAKGGGVFDFDEEPSDAPKGTLPKGWRQWSSKRQKSTRIASNSETMNRIGDWFGRKASTSWTVAEAGALEDINPSEDELDLIESYYTAVISEGDYRRRDLLTLLNNWNQELDRARIWKAGS